MRFAITTTAIALALCGFLTVAVHAQPAAQPGAQPTPTPPKPTPAAQPAPAQPAEATPAFPWEGEITGTNVYVRSAAGVNWYATTKLNTGDRVLVMSEKFGWYQIVPPKGSFSYIDKSMVERQPADSKTGTVKADKVHVRAGSELEDRKSATQMMLDKGAKVEILGEAEGFYKIAPPRGASLYVSKTYVEPVTSRLRTGLAEQYGAGEKTEAKSAGTPKPPTVATTQPAGGAATPTGAAATDAIPTTQEEEAPPLDVDPTVETTQTKTTPAGTGQPKSPTGAAAKSRDRVSTKTPASTRPRYEVMLTELENLMRAELRRPVKEQDLTSLEKRFEEIANQKDENIPAQIAKIRIQQLKDWRALVAARGDTAGSAAELEKFRAQLTTERAKIMEERKVKAAKKYDLEGELRRSFAFAAQQRRYRLVDPRTGTTIAYVDVPPTLNVDVENLVGCVVGIEASQKQFSPAARVPIAVAKDVVDLSSRNLPGGTGNPDSKENPENTGGEPSKSTADTTGNPPAKSASDKPLAAGGTPESPE